MSNYIVKTAAAAMPNSCWGVYRRVAVLEVQDGTQVTVAIGASVHHGEATGHPEMDPQPS